MALDRDSNERQYGTADKLAARARLHQLYSEDAEPWFGFVARHAALQAGQRVLDIGCGPAWFWLHAAAGLPDGLALTLADLSPGMVEDAVARVTGLGRDWQVAGRIADITGLPFADGSFDTVIAMHMLYHVADQGRAVAEIARVLRPGGRAVVTTNGRDNLRALYDINARAFGVDGVDPEAALFGFETARTLLGAQFGNVVLHRHPGRLRITEPDHVFEAQTSFPPGEDADAAQREILRAIIAEAFARGGGVLEAEKATGVFVSRKPAAG